MKVCISFLQIVIVTDDDGVMMITDYRAVFGEKHKVARTPPYGAMAKKSSH